MEYSWSEYYRKAYEAEKKKNILLAGKTADAEAKCGELQAKYASICANPLYRASKILSLSKRGIKKIGREMKKIFRGEGRTVASPELISAYKERLAFQKGAYRQWIGEEEPVLWRRCREALADRQEERGAGASPEALVDSGKRCLVIPYEKFSGITDLSSVTEGARPSGQAGLPDILLFAERPEDLEGGAVSYIEAWFGAHPETKLFYGAEDHRVGEERLFPWFKPCFSPDTLLGFFYFGSYFAVDRAWAEKTALSGYREAKQNLYDFVLRLLKPYFEREKSVLFEKDDGVRKEPGERETSERPRRAGEGESTYAPEIACTDLILYHREGDFPREIPADREFFLHAGEMCGEANPEFWGYEKEYIKLKQDLMNSICYETLSYPTQERKVWSVLPEPENEGTDGGFLLSVVIPSKDHPELLEKCIGSFVERTLLQDLGEKVEFIVVDNGSGETNRRRIESFLKSAGAACRYLYEPMPFNFSAMCNLGAQKARGTYILLLNDDMEVIEENWLHILLGQARLPGVGAVGAKLWYPEGEKIQHAGITNMRVGPSHKLVTFPDDRTYYYGYNTLPYDMIAVTGACLLVRRALYEEVGGFDEGMAVAYNDVDFCFKLLEAGYRNVVRNDAVLLHHESASRGLDEESEEKWQRLLEEKTALYNKHPLFYYYDPYYSEQLVHNAPEYRVGYQYPYERPLLTAVPERKEQKKALQRAFSPAVMLTVERAGKQHKIRLEEPDILMAEGWCYLLGQDNCLFERFLILEAERGDFYYQIPVKERLRPDVEAILPEQTNIELSGFTCRILKEHLISGNYTVGMLYRNPENGKLSFGRSDKTVTI